MLGLDMDYARASAGTEMRLSVSLVKKGYAISTGRK